MNINNQKNRNSFAGSGVISTDGIISGATTKAGSSINGRNGNKNNEKFQGNYFQWLKDELSGWDTLPWALFGFGAGLEVMSFALHPISWISIVTLIGTLFGMLCTIAMCAGGYRNGQRVISRSINGVLGAISVVAFIIVAVYLKHYFSVIDQLVFFSLIDVELMATWRTWGRGNDAPIKKLSKTGYVYAAIAMLIAWGLLYFIGIHIGDQQPIFDSLVLAMGAIASWLCFRRYSLTYKIWLLSDVAQIALFIATIVQAGYTSAALAMALNYGFYLATSVLGLINWKPTAK